MTAAPDLLRIGLPLPAYTAVDLLGAIRSTWPAAVVLTEHEYGPDTLVIRLEGPREDERHDTD